MTKAFREAQTKEKLERYPKVPEGQGPVPPAQAWPRSAKGGSAWLQERAEVTVSSQTHVAGTRRGLTPAPRGAGRDAGTSPGPTPTPR